MSRSKGCRNRQHGDNIMRRGLYSSCGSYPAREVVVEKLHQNVAHLKGPVQMKRAIARGVSLEAPSFKVKLEPVYLRDDSKVGYDKEKTGRNCLPVLLTRQVTFSRKMGNDKEIP
eukprot:TRINITY_DN1275_c0_g1_i2.p1 TRINITY_DN1275_c0_g1~~TRINITY_DN1275_c0_g1_i2.p1  ORF type:complete len:115 (-),score=12.76 TRINITY_DN1275_c0_g1_i2:146-490(-)